MQKILSVLFVSGGILLVPLFTFAIDLNSSHTVKVLVLQYFPRDTANRIIDSNVIDWKPTLGEMRSSLRRQIDTAKRSIEEGSRFRGQGDPAIRLELTEKEFLAPLPISVTRNIYYDKLLRDNNICDYVDNRGVREVWIFKVTFRSEVGIGQSESRQSSPFFGEVSNQSEFGKLPKCGATYRIITHDAPREDLFLEVWGHQLEFELKAVDRELAEKFLGPCNGSSDYKCYPLRDSRNPKIGRCGNMHNPPNARREYDRTNPVPNDSDCSDWKPDGLGRLTPVSCATWGCAYNSIEDNPVRNYITWLLQRMPGRNNQITYNGEKLRNWWDVYADYDGVRTRNERLRFLLDTTSPVVAIIAPTSGDTYTTADRSIQIRARMTDNGQFAARVIKNETKNSTVPCTMEGDVCVATLNLAYGENRIVAAATDTTGNSGYDVIAVTRLDLVIPSVQITGPTAERRFGTFDEQVTVAVNVSDNDQLTQVSIVNKANQRYGEVVTPPNGQVAWYVPLVIGKNRIVVKAKDRRGNMGKDVIIITRYSPVLTCSITGPAEVEPDTPFNISWQVAEGYTVTSLTSKWLDTSQYDPVRIPAQNNAFIKNGNLPACPPEVGSCTWGGVIKKRFDKPSLVTITAVGPRGTATCTYAVRVKQ